MKWNIVTDSSCDMFSESIQDGEIQVSSVPFAISIGNREFIDDEELDTEAMVQAMEQCKELSHSSCPSPHSWYEQFETAENIIAVTISSKLSGSMNSAMTAKAMLHEHYPDKKIAILDSHSTGPEIVLCVEGILASIRAGMSFEQVVAEAEALLERTHIAFALCSFDNLVKNGRMSKMAGFLARKLGMWGIGIGSDEGTIVVKGKTRGAAKAVSMLLENMKENGFCGGRVVISHCQNAELAEKLKDRIMELWGDSSVHILPTRGLCSYYAERGGLILSY